MSGTGKQLRQEGRDRRSAQAAAIFAGHRIRLRGQPPGIARGGLRSRSNRPPPETMRHRATQRRSLCHRATFPPEGGGGG